jgi:hypothetical protein
LIVDCAIAAVCCDVPEDGERPARQTTATEPEARIATIRNWERRAPMNLRGGNKSSSPYLENEGAEQLLR